MDEWRNKLVGAITGHAPTRDFRPDGSASLEIALGQARSEIAYVLSLAQAHRVAAAGSVMGDDVWLRLGSATFRVAFDRRAGVLVASVVGRDEIRITWNESKHSIVGPDGEAFDMREFVRLAIDETVAAWKTPQDVPVSK